MDSVGVGFGRIIGIDATGLIGDDTVIWLLLVIEDVGEFVVVEGVANLVVDATVVVVDGV